MSNIFILTRQEKIYDLLSKHKAMSVEEICSTICYSRSTVRRDLLELESMGAIQRNNGKVHLLVSSGKEKHRKLHGNEQVKAKQRAANHFF